jgi:hypothetical protein
MAYTPPTYTPSGSLFGSIPAATTYTYGSLAPTTSDYSLWGSRGNPYIVNGPSYTPGAGAPPIAPQPVAPVTYPINNGGGSSNNDGVSSGGDFDHHTNDNDWYASKWATEREPTLFDYTTLGMVGKAALGINPTNWGNKYF